MSFVFLKYSLNSLYNKIKFFLLNGLINVEGIISISIYHYNPLKNP